MTKALFFHLHKIMDGAKKKPPEQGGFFHLNFLDRKRLLLYKSAFGVIVKDLEMSYF